MLFNHLDKEFTVKKIHTEREINYMVSENGDYVCRLVPGFAGFELSKLDISLGVEVCPQQIFALGNYILQKDS